MQEILGVVVGAVVVMMQVSAYPTGAPDIVCRNMTVGHNRTDSIKGTEPPFKITHEFSNNKAIVAISGVDKDITFKGFLLQARNEADDIIGTFEPTDSAQGLDCRKDDTISAVTHRNHDPKKTVSMVWSCPSNFGGGTVIFKASVVEKYERFWEGLTSQKVGGCGV